MLPQEPRVQPQQLITITLPFTVPTQGLGYRSEILNAQGAPPSPPLTVLATTQPQSSS
jgi:hypothetical protein